MREERNKNTGAGRAKAKLLQKCDPRAAAAVLVMCAALRTMGLHTTEREAVLGRKKSVFKKQTRGLVWGLGHQSQLAFPPHPTPLPSLLTEEFAFPLVFVALPTTSLHQEAIDQASSPPPACSCLEAIILSEDGPPLNPRCACFNNTAEPVGVTKAVTEGSRTRNTESLMVPKRRSCSTVIPLAEYIRTAVYGAWCGKSQVTCWRSERGKKKVYPTTELNSSKRCPRRNEEAKKGTLWAEIDFRYPFLPTHAPCGSPASFAHFSAAPHGYVAPWGAFRPLPPSQKSGAHVFWKKSKRSLGAVGLPSENLKSPTYISSVSFMSDLMGAISAL